MGLQENHNVFSFLPRSGGLAEKHGLRDGHLSLHAKLPRRRNTSQLRRAAVSIASNIAEGQGRLSAGEFRQFLGHAKGSSCEVETQLLIARNLGYLDDRCAKRLIEEVQEVGRILSGLLGSLGHSRTRQ